MPEGHWPQPAFTLHPLPTVINPTALNLVLAAQQGKGGKGGEPRGRRSETDARQLWALQHVGNEKNGKRDDPKL